MIQLKSLIEEEAKRRAITADCVKLVESEVRTKTGLTGIAIKTAFSVVKAIKPGIIEELVDTLLDAFVAQLDPFVESYQNDGASGSLRSYLLERSNEVAESLLSVTDNRAERAKNKTILKAYNKLRPKAKEHVVAAVPGVGVVLDNHVKA